MRMVFGGLLLLEGALVTDEQQEAWIAAAAELLSRLRLGQCGPLTGQQHFVGINRLSRYLNLAVSELATPVYWIMLVHRLLECFQTRCLAKAMWHEGQGLWIRSGRGRSLDCS
jgi:hypothetical protein